MTTDQNQQEKIFLIDGSGFIFRAYFSTPEMVRPDGCPVNALYGFCQILQKIVYEFQSSKVGVVFDAGRKTFRNDLYPNYKSHRPAMPENLRPQLPLIRDAVRAYGLPAIELENYEADDLMAAYAKAAVSFDLPVVIVSGDKDFMQLLRPGVELYDPIKGVYLTSDDVMVKFGVEPARVIEVQALVGDAADNVPGVPGIGVKTAADLVRQYGDLEGVLAHTHEIKQPRRRELIELHADNARLSRQLVKLDENCPLPLPIGQIKQNQDREKLLEFLLAQNFVTLLERMANI